MEDNVLRLLCGACTGAIVKTVIAPIERLKILYETQTMFTTVDKLKYNNLLDAIRMVYNSSGLMGFWRGNGANLLRVVPNSAIKFATFDMYKRILGRLFPSEESYFIRTLGCGAMSGASQALVTYPLDLVRTRLAVYAHYKGVWHCLSSTCKNEGFFALYQGMGTSLLGVMPYVAVSMTVYDSCKKFVLNNDSPLLYRLIPGAIGSVCAGCITFPVDVVRRRLQLQGSDSTKKRIYNGSVHCAKTILKNEGMYGLYRGISLQMIRSAPSTSLQFVTYDFFKKMLNLN